MALRLSYSVNFPHVEVGTRITIVRCVGDVDIVEHEALVTKVYPNGGFDVTDLASLLSADAPSVPPLRKEQVQDLLSAAQPPATRRG